MRYVPFLTVYSNGKALLSTITDVVAGDVTDINAAIATVNAAPGTYGLDAGTVLPSLPSVPTGAVGLFYAVESGGQGGIAEALVDAHYTRGHELPDKTCEALLVPANLSAILTALAE